MDSQDLSDSPSVIPCSEEMTFSEDVGSEKNLLAQDKNNQLLDEPSQEMSQSLLDSQPAEISNIDPKETQIRRPPGDGHSVNNSTMDLEVSSSEINPMSSTRIDPNNSAMNPMSSTRIDLENSENSMSMMNEGFVIDSASLELSAVNDTPQVDMSESERNVVLEDEDEEMNDIQDESEEKENEKSGARHDSMDEEEEDSADYPLPQFPLGRVKKIMSICAAAQDEDEPEPSRPTKKGKKDQGKGNVMMSKEAVYLTTIATEHFVSAVGALAAEITLASKKKTLTFEHLKQALGDKDAFAFLEGCFQPHLI